MPASAACTSCQANEQAIDKAGTYVVEATRAAASPIVWPLMMAHDRRPKHSRMAAGARPSSIALASLASCGTCRATATSRMTITMATEPLRQLLLAKLLGFMQTHDKLFGTENNTIHGVHGSGSYSTVTRMSRRGRPRRLAAPCSPRSQSTIGP